MKFCPKCKSLLKPSARNLSCDCGYKEKIKEKIQIIEKPEHKEIEIIDEDNENIGDSIVPVVCWKCGHRGAYFWMIQMRRADEAPTKFYKCKKCKKVWRNNG